MSYIGNTATQQAFTPAVDFFSGNASTTAFTLSKPVASVAQVQAVISNVPQNPGDAFTVSGNTITFTSAPPSGTNNIYVYYTSPITQVIAPGQNTVTTTALMDGSVTPAKLSTGGPSWDTSGNVTVTGKATAAGVVSSAAANISGGGWGVLPYVANSTVIDNNAGQTRIFATGADASTYGTMLMYAGTTNGSATLVGSVGRNLTFALQGGTQSAGTGIAFPAAQSASSDVNTLDDYEEGTWTPALAFGGGTTGITYSSQVGRYTKVGNIVTLQCYVQLSNKGSSSGAMTLTGFPFGSASGSNNYCAVACWANTLTGITGGLIGYVNPASSFMYWYCSTTGAVSALQNTNCANTSDFMINVTYQAA
jgi:hypothetical protein